MSTATHTAEHRLPLIEDRGRVGVICFLCTEAAFFSTLLVAYAMYMGRNTTGPTPRDCLDLTLGIINTVLLAILGVVDYGMNIQEAIDAPRFHHQWLPDKIRYERYGLSPDTRAVLRARGHALDEVGGQGVAQGIVYDAKEDVLEGGADRRSSESAAIGW